MHIVHIGTWSRVKRVNLFGSLHPIPPAWNPVSPLSHSLSINYASTYYTLTCRFFESVIVKKKLGPIFIFQKTLWIGTKQKFQKNLHEDTHKDPRNTKNCILFLDYNLPWKLINIQYLQQICSLNSVWALI